MGYDMTVVDDNLEDVFQITYPEVYDEDAYQNVVRPQIEERDKQGFYWRRNLSGGSWQANILVDAGMAYWPKESIGK